MIEFIFGFFFIISIIGWSFIDSIFEANKNQKKYPRKKYRIQYYVIDFVREFWGRAFDIKGKTKRKNFWLTLLVLLILNLLFIGLPVGFYVFYELNRSSYQVASFIGLSEDISYLSWFVAIVNLIPSFSMQVRRLNDIGKERGWVLLNFVPFISFLLVFWYSKPSLRKNFSLVKEPSNNSRENNLNNIDYVEERLEKIKNMFERGVISKEEYQELRKKTLGL